MMKLLIFLVVSIATAQAVRDWSQIRHRQIDPVTKKSLSFHESRIVGGQEAAPNQFPYQVALFVHVGTDIFFCGGSLISANYVLTSGHCVDETIGVEVLLGAHNIFDESEPNRVNIFSTDVILHEEFVPSIFPYDLAVIKLPESIEFNEHIQPVKMPRYRDTSEDYADEISTVSGWGKDSDNSAGVSDRLRYVEVPVMAHDACTVDLPFIEDYHVCSNGENGKGMCAGDIGGALVIDNVQIGIGSFNFPYYCEMGFPSVFTRTTIFLDWFSTNTDVVIEF